MYRALIFLFLLRSSYTAFAQGTEHQAWIFFTHKQKLDQHSAILVDVQLRSADRYQYLATTLLRSAYNYDLNDHHSIALGYAFKKDKEFPNDVASYPFEHRFYEQYIFNFNLRRTEFMLRSRLEQRWVTQEQTSFAQRGRAFISAQIPLAADAAFKRGMYTTIQNEIFFNLQGKRHINNSFFDQNRSLLSLGYRWNKSVDTEAGYMYWLNKEMEGTIKSNVIQVMITTNF